ncbi:hypothetical protein LDENG_00290500 [Lucifuga dentata]|nr:hypothetical protein LDENG_00290500 [Lucifuga dentata]
MFSSSAFFFTQRKTFDSTFSSDPRWYCLLKEESVFLKQRPSYAGERLGMSYGMSLTGREKYEREPNIKPKATLKDHITYFACLSLIYSIFIHVTLLTIISQRIKPYFSFPDILLNLLIFQNQIFK